MIDPEEFEYHIEHADDIIVRKIMSQTKVAHDLLNILRKAISDQPIEVIEMILDELKKPSESLQHLHDHSGLDMFTRKALGSLLQAMSVEMDYSRSVVLKRKREQNNKLNNIITS